VDECVNGWMEWFVRQCCDALPSFWVQIVCKLWSIHNIFFFFFVCVNVRMEWFVRQCSIHNLHTIGITGWRRCIGCLSFQVSLRKRATNYRALLQKMTCKDKASYESSAPCVQKSKLWMYPQFAHNWYHRAAKMQRMP